MLLTVTVVAFATRRGCPARHPSPKKSPGPSIATTASLPLFESTDSLTPPCWMYMTLSQPSPWAKMTSERPYSTIVFESPAELRKACTLNLTILQQATSPGLQGVLTPGPTLSEPSP